MADPLKPLNILNMADPTMANTMATTGGSPLSDRPMALEKLFHLDQFGHVHLDQPGAPEKLFLLDLFGLALHHQHGLPDQQWLPDQPGLLAQPGLHHQPPCL